MGLGGYIGTILFRLKDNNKEDLERWLKTSVISLTMKDNGIISVHILKIDKNLSKSIAELKIAQANLRQNNDLLLIVEGTTSKSIY